MLLNVENISVSYGKIAALKNVSVTIGYGEIVVIIGANGAGKTTLINTISGVVEPSGGRVVFQDESISGIPAWKTARKGVVQVPEGRKVFPKLSVSENMELGAYAEQNKSKIGTMKEEMYSLFPVLKDRRYQLAGTLSGGEQQMLAIARALMAKPKLIMFDEPSMGLAPIVVEKVFQVITDINKKGIPILLVEQNAKKSLQIASRAYLLETGSVVMSGSGSDMLNNDQIKKSYLGG